MMQNHSIPEPKPWLSQQAMLSFIILAMYRWMTNDKNETKQLSVVILHIPDDLSHLPELAALHSKLH
jgi:hypothetical protein